ncbi:hypothetical protein K402DRAFT_140735 [Aulographum hederae CBS 113979]|uniref:Uncharacterized protein n=1 Tax=Aulographum hederae CBS 113979 TaxID=1176131 RepID=A0A6G1GUK6_9PEZI|nr:hypothetical protein K402DRAFT_140735 [Aulographum hederae CBS 113979]
MEYPPTFSSTTASLASSSACSPGQFHEREVTRSPSLNGNRKVNTSNGTTKPAKQTSNKSAELGYHPPLTHWDRACLLICGRRKYKTSWP